MAISDERFVSFTTCKKSGDAVSTPTWVVPVSDGRVGFWTAMGTGKTKRLKNNPQVTLQPCGQRGAVKEGTPIEKGTAEMVQSGPLFDEVQAAVRAKYGFMVRITGTLAKLGPQRKVSGSYGDTVVLVRLDPSPVVA